MRPDTYEWYRYRIQRFIDRHPTLTVRALRPYHVETWADSYGLSVTSRRNYLRSVKRCLAWAAKQGYIDRSPIEALEVPKAEAREVYVPSAEFENLFNYVDNPAFAALLSVTYSTGCRPQESLRVEAQHVDKANQRWVFPKTKSKGKRLSRIVYMTDDAMHIINRLMLANPEGPLFRNSHGRPWTTDAVNCAFLSIQLRMGKEEMARRGERISDDAIAAFIPSLAAFRSVKGKKRQKTPGQLRTEAKRKLTNKRAAELAPRYSLYALRHSWCTNALKMGLDSLTVAILMGHEDPSTLARVYQHLSMNPKHLLEQAKKAAG